MEAMARSPSSTFFSASCSLQTLSIDRSFSRPLHPSTSPLCNSCSSRFLRRSRNLPLQLPPRPSPPSPSLLASRKPSPSLIFMRHNAASGYAAALADIGRTENVLESINSDISQLGSLLHDQEFYGFLVNPTVRDEDKKDVLKTLADNAGFVPFTLNLLHLVVDRKRTSVLKDIVKEFEELYFKITDTEVAVVTSAIKINTDRLAEIATKVQRMSGARNVRMKNIVDPSLVAGFIVRYGKDGSRLIDMSVKNQLALISQQINSVKQPQPDSVAV